MSLHTDSVMTETEFNQRLNQLLEVGRRNEFEIRGAWPCTQTQGRFDYEVLVSAVTPPQ